MKRLCASLVIAVIGLFAVLHGGAQASPAAGYAVDDAPPMTLGFALGDEDPFG